MKDFELVRIDRYAVTVRAKNEKDALKRAEDEEQYLNNGIFCGSSFELEV